MNVRRVLTGLAAGAALILSGCSSSPSESAKPSSDAAQVACQEYEAAYQTFLKRPKAGEKGHYQAEQVETPKAFRAIVAKYKATDDRSMFNEFYSLEEVSEYLASGSTSRISQVAGITMDNVRARCARNGYVTNEHSPK